MSSRMVRAAYSVAMMATMATAQNGDAGTEAPEPEPDPERETMGQSQLAVEDGEHAGGHTGDLWKTAQCIPIACGDSAAIGGHDLHGSATDTGSAMATGCREAEIWNFMKNETESLFLTCQGCVPHTCGFGEHDCVPTVCADEHGETHGGHASDPCAGGHHADDGLGWWPFLLVCLLSTVCVTTFLTKLGNGACCGKSLNPPFTVVMFFFGYACSAIAVHDDLEGMREALGEHVSLGEILFESVGSWKNAHPHVILFVLLPPLLFEDASGMDYYIFRKVLVSSMLLAGPGVGLSMGLTAATTMLLFGFAEECVVETDPHTHVQMVEGARENMYFEKTEGAANKMYVCDPMENPDWQEWEATENGGFACIECIKGVSHTSEQLPVAIHLLLGGMLAATDPVAVCAVLNDLGCPDKLNFMIAGESLLNDGTAVVAFLVMQSVAGGCDTSAAKVMISLIRLAGGGVLWGMFMSAVAYNFIKSLRDPNIEITTLVFCTMTCFWMAENVLYVSGVLGTVVFGVQTARTSFLAMDEHTHHANHAFWGEVGYVATSFIFILAGVKSRDKIASFLDNFSEDFDSEHRTELCSSFNPDCDVAGREDTDFACASNLGEMECLSHHVCLWKGHGDLTRCTDDTCCLAGEVDDDKFHLGNQLGLNVVLWIILTFIRAFVVLCLSPILKNIGYGLTVKEACVMVWGGLRGAVSLSLALLIDGNHLIGDRAREMIFLQTTGIVTLTLIVNGTTSGMVYKWLDVYPPNPFRPVLATQGLRNLQIEMDKFIGKLAGHWFHANAEQATLKGLMPNFSESHIYDGDLVDVKMDGIHGVWKNTLTAGSGLSPQRMTLQTAEGIKTGVTAGINILRLKYNSVTSSGADGYTAPDAYGEIVIIKGSSYTTFETSVVKSSSDPEWSVGNAKAFKLPPGDEAVEMYIHMFDNDLGEIDEYVGQAYEDITDLVKGKVSKQFNSPLTVCSSAVKDREYDGKMPYEVCGNIAFDIKCSDDEVVVTLSSAMGIGGAGVKRGDPSVSEGVDGGDHEHEHAHGHGHGASHITMLKNVKRWLDESKEEVESKFAMYDVMLSTMKASFFHELEGKMLSVAGFSKLNAAVGIALDLNNVQMEGSIAQKMTMASAEGAGATSIETWQRLKPEEWSTPVDAAVNYVLDFCSSGEAFIQTPAAFFQHRLVCAEMLLTLTDQLKQLAEADLSDLGEDFAGNLASACTRAKLQLADMQSLSPNTFRACHTLIAFKVIAAEFHHRVHMYQDQGFFQETLVEGCEFVMEGREREIQQYFNIDPLWTAVGMCTKFICMKDHPVVYLYEQDQDGVTDATASGGDDGKTANPAADDDEEGDQE